MGTHDTTIAGRPATVIVGAGYNPTQPTYLAFYLHGDEGGYNFHTSAFNPINQFINTNNWIYVAPQAPKATDGDYYPWDGRGGGSIYANETQVQDVLEHMFANYNVCKDILFGSSVSGGSWFWDIFFFPRNGAQYPAFINLVCGAGGPTASTNYWGSYDNIQTLGGNANIVARSDFKYTIGDGDFMYTRAQDSVATYSSAGFSVTPDYLGGVSHCMQGATTTSSEKIRDYWQEKFNVLITVNLTLAKTASPNPVVESGEVLTYTLVAKNTGSITATNIIITDTVPANTTFSWASDGGTAAGTTPGSLITWNTGLSLSTNSALTRTFVVTVANGLTDGILIVNTGYLSATNISNSETSNALTICVGECKRVYLPIIFNNY